MEQIEQQAKALLAALIAAERRCLYYEPKDPRRDPDYRRACHAYGDALTTLDDWMTEFLLPALEAEEDAGAEESVVSALFILIVAAWVALIAAAFIASCVQAVVHFLPSPAPAWEAPMAPTLAEERAA